MICCDNIVVVAEMKIIGLEDEEEKEERRRGKGKTQRPLGPTEEKSQRTKKMTTYRLRPPNDANVVKSSSSISSLRDDTPLSDHLRTRYVGPNLEIPLVSMSSR